MKTLKLTALIIMIIGALNWGLIGMFNFNLVAFLFDGLSVVVSRIVYSLVGIAGITALVCLFVPDTDVERDYSEHDYKLNKFEHE